MGDPSDSDSGSDPDADPNLESESASSDDVGNLPTISCTRCGREWDLAYELDELVAGNQAVEQFALDHKRHTGHFPDDAATWLAHCRQCPEGVERLSSNAVRRWAETHARHTRHRVAVSHGTDGEQSLVGPDDWESSSASSGDVDHAGF